MACPPMYTEPPKRMKGCPEPVYVTGGTLEVCGLSLEGATLNVELEGVENLLTELTATLEACCDTTNGNLTSIKETIATEASKIVEAIKACCAATGQQEIIDTLKELLAALEACCETLSGLLGQLVTELKEVNSELDKQTTELKEINSELDKQTTELKEINSELDKQTTLLTTLISEVSKVTAAIEECCEAVTGLLSQILTELKEVNSELDKQTTELKEVNSELDKQTSELTSIDNKLDKLTSIESILGQILAALNKPDYDIEHTEICVGADPDNGVTGSTWVRVDRYKDGAPDVQGLTWYDASGAPVAAPAGGYTVGRCCCEVATPTCCNNDTVTFVDCKGNTVATFTNKKGETLTFVDCKGNTVASFSCDACDTLTMNDCKGNTVLTLG